MNFKSKLILFAAVSQIMSFVSPAYSDSMIPLKYTTIDVKNPLFDKLWGDYDKSEIEPIIGNVPYAAVAKVKLMDGKEMYISHLMDRMTCGASECPTRVLKGDELLDLDRACFEFESMSINRSGSVLNACGNMRNIR